MVQASCAVRRGQGEEEIDHAVFVWVLALPYQAKLIARCRPEQTECNNDASLGTECQLSLFSFFCGIAVVVNFARGHVTSKWVIYISLVEIHLVSSQVHWVYISTDVVVSKPRG